MLSFEIGEIYDRQRQIHGAVPQGQGRGNNSSGITKVAGQQYIFWNPYRKAYANEWLREPSEFVYSGEGSTGDMAETGGNADLLRHEANGDAVFVFYKVAPSESRWKFLGGYLIADHWYGSSPDVLGKWRRDIRFRLIASTGKLATLGSLPSPAMKFIPTPVEAELWETLVKSPRFKNPERMRKTAVHRDKRSSDPLKTLYVTSRAIKFGGACELCDRIPDWTTEEGLPHYQAHHLDPDLDVVESIVAVCGTCHDRLHHDRNRDLVTHQLQEKILRRHHELGHPRSAP